MPENYAFKIKDNSIGGEGYVHYIGEGKRLRCTSEEVEAGLGIMTSLKDFIDYLKSRDITNITTFFPQTEKVCSHPYEITSEGDFEACESDGLWYRFHHFALEREETEQLKRKGIETIILSQNEEAKLNLELEYYPE